jgi:outer membrane receptor for monomeric catechols
MGSVRHLIGPLICVAGVLAACAAVAQPHKRASRSSAETARTTNQRESGYYVPYATGPGGEQVPIMEIPGSVTVVPRRVMDDQGSTTLCGALRNVSGVTCR